MTNDLVVLQIIPSKACCALSMSSLFLSGWTYIESFKIRIKLELVINPN